MDKNKAEQVLAIAQQILKLQESFKEVTGTAFQVSQNLLDAVNFSNGFLTALNTNVAPKLEVAKDEVKDESANKPS